MASNLPSSFSRGKTGASQPYSPPEIKEEAPKSAPKPLAANSSLPLLIAVVALAISLVSFYGAFFADRPFSTDQKAALLEMASSLKSLQNRDVSISAPVETTIVIDRSYPIKDLFPAHFDIPLDFNIPIDTQLIGVGSTGQPVVFRVQENVPIKAKIPISSEQAFGTSTIRIQKELPVEMKFTSTVKTRLAYGKELNAIIDRLEQMAGEPAN